MQNNLKCELVILYDLAIHTKIRCANFTLGYCLGESDKQLSSGQEFTIMKVGMKRLLGNNLLTHYYTFKTSLQIQIL